MKNVIFTKHALERAKQRLSQLINIESDLLFQYEIKKIFNKSIFQYSDGKLNIFCINVNDKQVTFKVIIKDNKYIVITIIVK